MRPAPFLVLLAVLAPTAPLPLQAQQPSCQLVLLDASGVPSAPNHQYRFHGLCSVSGGASLWVDGEASWSGADFRAVELLSINEGGGGSRRLTIKCLKGDPWLPAVQQAGNGVYDLSSCAIVQDQSSAPAFPQGAPPLVGFATLALASALSGGSSATPGYSVGSLLPAQPSGATTTGRLSNSGRGGAPLSGEKSQDMATAAVTAAANSWHNPIVGSPWGGILKTEAFWNSPPRGLNPSESVALRGGLRLVRGGLRDTRMSLLGRDGRALKLFPAGAQVREARSGELAVLWNSVVFPLTAALSRP